MPEEKRYRCLNCGHRFVTEVFSPEEQRDAEREGRSFSRIKCPECGRIDNREGWE